MAFATLKSILVVDSDPLPLQEMLRTSRFQTEISAVDTVAHVEGSLEAIIDRSPPYDACFIGLMPQPVSEYRLSQASCSPLWARAAQKILPFEASGKVYQSQGLQLLAALKELLDSRQQGIRPYLVLTNALSFPPVPSIQQQAIEQDCFDYVNYLHPDTVLNTLFMMDIPGILPVKPTIYALAGTKATGKSEIVHSLSRSLPGIVPVPKYSSRQQARRDAIYGDTLPWEQLRENHFRAKDNVLWQSYNDTCCILRSALDSVLEGGNDAVIAIGQPEGLDSLLQHYPSASVVVLYMDPSYIQQLLSARADNTVDIDRVLEVNERFYQYSNSLRTKDRIERGPPYVFQLRQNRLFFSVVHDLRFHISQIRLEDR